MWYLDQRGLISTALSSRNWILHEGTWNNFVKRFRSTCIAFQNVIVIVLPTETCKMNSDVGDKPRSPQGETKTKRVTPRKIAAVSTTVVKYDYVTKH
jgi:hypothetical protein